MTPLKSVEFESPLPSLTKQQKECLLIVALSTVQKYLLPEAKTKTRVGLFSCNYEICVGRKSSEQYDSRLLVHFDYFMDIILPVDILLTHIIYVVVNDSVFAERLFNVACSE